MPYEFSWYIEGRVIFTRAYGVITLEDLRQGNARWTEILDNADAELIHSLVEMTDVEKYPTSVFQMGDTQSYLKHPKLGWVVAYGLKGTVVNFIISVLTQVSRAQIRVLESHDDAIAYLRKVDKTLPDLNRNDE